MNVRERCEPCLEYMGTAAGRAFREMLEGVREDLRSDMERESGERLLRTQGAVRKVREILNALDDKNVGESDD